MRELLTEKFYPYYRLNKSEAFISTVAIDYYRTTPHSFRDTPAFICSDGKRIWYKYGKTHRGGDKPAVIYEDGNSMEWWSNGNLHREGDKPALIHYYGDGILLSWYKNGQHIKEKVICLVEYV